MKHLACILACAFCAASAVAEPEAERILAGCRESLPSRPVKLTGSIILRNRKGIPSGEYGYTLVMNRSSTPATLAIDIHPRGKTNVIERIALSRPGPVPEGFVMNTDVKWLDLSLDFLWWRDPHFETERTGESVHGQTCNVILVSPPDSLPGIAAARLWADRKNGCLMQAEELDSEMRPRRRLWGTRIKKFGERWMANVLEVETLGSGHRTKITVDSLEDVQ